MNIPQYVSNILTTLMQAGYTAYLVGGCVRDYLLGLQPQDYDIATSALPEQVMHLFPKTVPTGLQHGTVTILTPEGACEVTTYRGGKPYGSNRHQAHPFSKTIEEDLAHRDFTVNAIAYDGYRYVDPFHGREDLKHKCIRAVGNPRERFEEDALRMLRAVRFAAQFQFTLDIETKAAIKQELRLIESTSVERIRDELSKLLLSPHPVYGLRLMEELGLLKVILPELVEEEKAGKFAYLSTKQGFSTEDKSRTWLAVMEYTPPHLAVRWAALLRDLKTARNVLKRLRFSRQNLHLVTNLLREVEFLHESLEKGETLVEWNLVEIKKMMVRLGISNVDLFFQLLIAQTKAGVSPIRQKEIKRLREQVRRILLEKHPLTVHDLAIDGQDLLNLGLSTGPEIGNLLSTLLEQVLADPDLNKKETLLNIAEKRIKKQ